MTGNTGQMELSFFAKDNIDEILIKVVEFTQARYEIISDNIKKCRLPGFVPKRLDAEEFATLISAALAEHLKNNRLVLCDGQTVMFGSGGELTVKPKIDDEAAAMKNNDYDRYIELQKKRLKENVANNKLAVALYEQKARKTALAAG